MPVADECGYRKLRGKSLCLESGPDWSRSRRAAGSRELARYLVQSTVKINATVDFRPEPRHTTEAQPTDPLASV